MVPETFNFLIHGRCKRNDEKFVISQDSIFLKKKKPVILNARKNLPQVSLGEPKTPVCGPSDYRKKPAAGETVDGFSLPYRSTVFLYHVDVLKGILMVA